MAKNANTYEKRRKEMERMRKATEKREKRRARKSGAVVDPESAEGVPPAQEPNEGDAQSETQTETPSETTPPM